MVVEGFEDAPDLVVLLHDEVGVGVEAAFTAPGGGGENWGVRAGEGEVDEEGLAGFGVGGFFTDEGHGFVG